MALGRIFRHRAISALVAVVASLAGACAPGDDDSVAAGDDLTSVTARSRTLEFVGSVFVDPTLDDADILATVRRQAQTAFGPLRTADMAVRSRELKEIDASTFVKREVKVVDPNTKATRHLVEVKYTYKDEAVVSPRYADRSSAPLALLSPDYKAQLDRVMSECTRNDPHAREFRTSAWYIFEPSLPQCGKAILAEQQKIDADRQRLADPENEVSESEVRRLYIPITAQLGADKTNQGKSFPEYHRLFSGGVEKDKLVASLVFGMIGHDANTPPSKDMNWSELMTALSLVMEAHGDFSFAAGPAGQEGVDLSRFELASGKVVESPSFADLVRLRSGKSNIKLTPTEASDLEAQFSNRILKHWIAVERPIRVSVGGAPARDFTLKMLVYWGAAGFSAPHKFATKNSDVFIYNGHSSIGYGPLDPKNFSAADFPRSYQVLWLDGCVSYNYYNKDYIPLKEGGTKNLDLVTNGLEASAWRGGKANGQFLAALMGANSSYRDLLLAAKDTEAMRVVDGELDNEFDPNSMKTKVTIEKK